MRRTLPVLAVVVTILAVIAATHSAVGQSTGITVETSRAGSRTLKRCPAVMVRAIDARGGCEVESYESTVRLTALTLFGDRQLGRCGFQFRMQLGGDGELAITQVELSPPPGMLGSTICGDISSCQRHLEAVSNLERIPWTGRLIRDGGATYADVDACFDSCFGRFEGKARFSVSQTEHGLRIEADRAALGISGLEISGSWHVEPFFGDSIHLKG